MSGRRSNLVWRLAACLAIGAAASLLIPSWLWTHWNRDTEAGSSVPAGPPPEWLASKFTKPELIEGDSLHLRMAEIRVYIAPGAQPGSREYAQIVEIGWPFRSARAWSYGSVGPGVLLMNPYRGDPEHGTIRVDGRVYFVVYYVPNWPGFALNTLLFGAVAFPLTAVPAVIRRRLRARRGRCPNCGYDLRGLRGRPCPECGR